MLNNEGHRLRRVVVSTPRKEYFRVHDPVALNIPEIADPSATLAQFHSLISILEQFDCDIIDIPELSGHPNSVFTRDTALVTPEGFIALRMGLPERRGEDGWMADQLTALGEPCVGQIRAPGTVEGGDVILSGSIAFVGESSRTNANGIEQLRQWLEPMGYALRTAPVSGSLHLGGLMSAVGPDKVLCCPDMLPETYFMGYTCIEIPYEGHSNGNVICIQENEVIVNISENQIAAEHLTKHGIKVHALDLSEFRKGAGGPTCLILPLERKP